MNKLMDIASRSEIPVASFPLHCRPALSIMDDFGGCSIAIDRRQISSSAQERVILAHELGHCMTGSFYNQFSRYDLRQKHENRAERWAILQLVPEDQLQHAVAAGRTELWELAEWFNVTQPFIEEAIFFYQNGYIKKGPPSAATLSGSGAE